MRSRSSVPPSSAIARPIDFDTFWRDTLRELARVPAAIGIDDGDSQASITQLVVEFNSLGGQRVHGYLLRWDDPVPRPLVVYTHGYNGRVDVLRPWAEAGFHVLGFDTRGFGRSPCATHPDGWILTGIGAPRSSILRGAVCDYVRAITVARALCAPRVSRTLAYGFSFAGAMAIMAEAVSGTADMVTAGVPSLGWMAGRRHLVRLGSGKEVNDYIAAHPQRESQVMHTLAYFDSANFAAAITKPTLIGVGRKDIVVPAETVQAISDRLQCEHRVMTFPYSHSDHPDERLWLQFEQAWQLMLTQGRLVQAGTAG
ncbi:MAG: acetylxylan esterase [Gammaproteobacteria bacterium]|nr:acetylxylan esterase [Gammaproteobacteria bacterium]